MMVNMFVMVIAENYDELYLTQGSKTDINDSHVSEFKLAWKNFDPEGCGASVHSSCAVALFVINFIFLALLLCYRSGSIPAINVLKLLLQLPLPLGISPSINIFDAAYRFAKLKLKRATDGSVRFNHVCVYCCFNG